MWQTNLKEMKMIQINLDLRQQLALSIYQAFNFAEVVADVSPWQWSKDFLEATRTVALAVEKNGPSNSRLRGVKKFVTFTVKFNRDNTVKTAYALDDNDKSAGKPARPYPLPPAISFDEWIALVEGNIGSDVEPAAYRSYFERGLLPADAVLLDRMAEGLLERQPAPAQAGGISRRAATAAGRNQGIQPDMPEQVRIALEHVASIFPEVTHVFFSRESRWFFCDDSFNAPSFEGKPIHISLLEDAADCLTALPAAFTLVK
jgi:hypothetical protein